MTDATGLLNLRARAYDPAVGRFLSQDSFGGWAAVPASANRYAYGLGNPLRYADPSGYAASAIVNHFAANPGEAVELAASFVFARFWGLTAMVSGAIGYDVWTNRALSDTERLVYAALGAFAVVTSFHLPTALEADVARLGAGASRLDRLAGEARLGGGVLRVGRAGSLAGRESGALARTETAGLRRTVFGASEREAATLNRAGRPYPQVVNPGTGKLISFPGQGLSRVTRSERVTWGPQERGNFIREWHERGFEAPQGGWSNYDIHHIVPREFGGTNAFENLVPVQREIHQFEFNAWWREY